jgi:hypothetical protein
MAACSGIKSTYSHIQPGILDLPDYHKTHSSSFASIKSTLPAFTHDLAGVASTAISHSAIYHLGFIITHSQVHNFAEVAPYPRRGNFRDFSSHLGFFPPTGMAGLEHIYSWVAPNSGKGIPKVFLFF